MENISLCVLAYKATFNRKSQKQILPGFSQQSPEFVHGGVLTEHHQVGVGGPTAPTHLSGIEK